jgi:hypothetical protein
LPGTFSGSAGGTVRFAHPIFYPSIVLDPVTSIWHLWATNANDGTVSHYTTADPLTSASAWATAASGNAFGGTSTANGIIDASVRRHPYDGNWYAIGFQNNTDPPLVLLRATNPNQATWTQCDTPNPNSVTARANATAYIVGDTISAGGNKLVYFQCTTAGTSAGSQPGAFLTAVAGTSVTDGSAVWLGKTYGIFTDIGEPSWATDARFDPNLAFTADGRAYALFCGYNSGTPSTRPIGMVELNLSTGRAIGSVIKIENSAPTAITGDPAKWLAEPVYVQKPDGTDEIWSFVATVPTLTDVTVAKLALSTPANYPGEGYPGAQPRNLKLQVGCGTAGALVDVSSSVDPFSWRIRRTAGTGMVTAECDLDAWTDLIAGTRYVLQDWQNVRITDTDTGEALFMGYVMEVSDTPDGAEKKYHLACQSVHIDLHKPTRQITTQYPPLDGTPVVLATGLTAVSAGTGRTFTVLSTTSLRNIYIAYTDSHGRSVRARRMIAQNLDGTNREVIFATAISGLTVTADFVSAKTAGWTLTGGLPAYDLIVGGWKQVDSAGVNQPYQGLLDEYFNTPPSPYTSLTVLRNAVSDTNMSLPHTKFQAATPYEALQQIAEMSYVPNVRHTVSASASAGSNVTVTPDSMTGIAAGAFIYMSNENGSNPERQMVRTAGGSSFTVTLTYSKTGSGAHPWIINTGEAPYFYMTWDNSFTRQLVYVSAYDFTLNTPIELTDNLVINSAQAHYNTGFSRRIWGSDRGSKVTVMGQLNSQGSYEDTTATTALGRVVELKPVQRDDVLTDAIAAAVAQQIVSGFSKSKETVQQIATHQQISSRLFRSAQIVRWTGNLEGGTPAYYPITDVELSYPEGVALYTFTLGDRLAELGDKAYPAFGAGTFHDLNPPETPTWAGGSAWIIANVFYPYLNQTIITVEATLSGELDLAEAHFAYRVNSGQWRYSEPVAVAGGATSAQYTTAPVTLGSTVDFQAWAVDTSRNASGLSSIATLTAASRVLPNAPTGLSELTNRYNPETGLVDVQEAFTIPGQPSGINVTAVQAVVSPHSSFTRFIFGDATSPLMMPNLPPGTVCDIYMQSIDQSGLTSAASSTHSFTTAPAPTNDTLPNGNFLPAQWDTTKPALWTLTDSNGGASSVDSSVGQLQGYYALKQALTFTIGTPQSIALSSPVVCYNSSTIDKGRAQRVGAEYFSTLGGGTYTISVRWYDKGNTNISTTIMFTGSALANKRVPLEKTVTPPATALYCKLELKYVGVISNSTLYWGSAILEPALPAAAVGSGTGGWESQATGPYGRARGIYHR